MYSTPTPTPDVRRLHDYQSPSNLTNPIRLAFLGGPKSGKTSLISKLTLGNFMDTYYPTNKVNPILFNFEPESKFAQDILKGKTISNTKYYNLPPILHREITGPSSISSSTSSSSFASPSASSSSSNPNIAPKATIQNNGRYQITPDGQITPILIELIDTPSFNPKQVVPFLEASLYTNLDKEILRNLANEPRKPVSTNPLLVASGASELNGNVDGYFFVYSAIASYNPPAYEEGPNTELSNQHTFSLLAVMKDALDDAWEEYNKYKSNWEVGQEADVFSFKNAFKGLWKDDKTKRANKWGENNTSFRQSPPVWIVCTHTRSQLASAKLIEDGKQLSRDWNCGFIAVDSTNDDEINLMLPLMIRDIVEVQRIRKR